MTPALNTRSHAAGSRKGLSVKTKALAVGVSLMLSACGSTVQYWTPPSAPKENRVERISFGHQVLFQGNNASLSNGERFRFEKFLNEIGLGFADDVQPGDWVSVHWGWACEVLTPEQVDNLERYSRLNLAIANQTL